MAGPVTSRRASDLALKAFALLVFAFIMAPIVSIVVFSFNVDRFPSLPWAGFSLQWYGLVLQDETVWRGFVNSLTVAGATSLLATFIGFATAYVDYRYRFVGKSVYLALAVLPPTVPVLILGLAMLSFLSRIQLTGTLQAVIIGHVVFCAPFAMALVRMRLAELEENIEQAAWNLGANQWTTLATVVVPFCLPAILAALFITAAVSFDEFMIAWFTAGVHETLPVRVLAMMQGQVSPRINAVGSIVFVVSIALVAVAQVATFSWAVRARQRRRRAA